MNDRNFEKREEIRLVRSLRSFDREELIEALYLKLSEVERLNFGVDGWFRPPTVPSTFWLPWNLLFLIELVLRYGRQRRSRRAPSDDQVRRLMTHVHALGAWLPPEGTRERSGALFRTVLFHQIPWGKALFWSDAARLRHLLFGSRQSETALGRVLTRQTGVPANEIAASLVALWLRFSMVGNGRPNISSHLLRLEKLGAPLEVMKGTLVGGPQALADHCRRTRPLGAGHLLRDEAFARSPLLLKPILETPRGIVVLSSHALAFSLREGFLWTLREAAETRSAVDRSFEMYVRTIGRECAPGWMEEGTLVSTSEAGKVVDGAFPSGDTDVLVEAKAVTLKPKQALRPTTRVMVESTKNSLVKAYLQGLATARRIARRQGGGARRTPVLVVVTLGDTLMGNVGRTWDEFWEEGVRAALRGGDSLDAAAKVLDPRDLFVLSIEEFERLMSEEKRSPGFAERFLGEVARSNQSPETAKLMVAQHLDKLGVALELGCLNDSWKELQQDMRSWI